MVAKVSAIDSFLQRIKSLFLHVRLAEMKTAIEIRPHCKDIWIVVSERLLITITLGCYSQKNET